MIKRLHPGIGLFSQSPLDVYNLLLLGQGFAPGEFDNIARATWSLITSVTPLSYINAAAGSGKYMCAVHYDDGAGIDLKISQVGNVLSIPAAESERLDN